MRAVMENLNTHRPAFLHETFPPAEARRIVKRLAFHYTPKHGSWLNMAEIEFSILSRSCLKQRLPDEETLWLRNATPPKPPYTGGSILRTPGPNFTAFTLSIPRLTDF